MDKLFRIGDFCFRLQYPEEITPPPNFLIFETETGEPEYTYTIRIAEDFPPPEGKILANRADLVVFQTETGESRLLGVKGTPGFYALYRELAPHRAEVLLAPDRLRGLNIDPVFTSLLALERRMVQRGGMVLHCAYMQYQDEAILFSAPSETGKTTQANLWGKYRGGRTVNGDRALLSELNGRWTARGWPVCGTSEICNNQDTPIRAIVMLSQSKENTVRLLKPHEAFMLLYGQITVNRWDRASTAQTLDRMESLLAQVPVYQLACNISEDAVRCLETALYT